MQLVPVPESSTTPKSPRAPAIVLGLCILFAAFALFTPTSRAQAPDAIVADLELILAVDASGSVDAGEFELQRRGYADAFRDPQVQSAIASGGHQAIAVTMVQWTGPQLQRIVVPWTLVRGREGAKALADRIESAPRQLFGGGTSISGAIDFSVAFFSANPHKGERRVIDISGDGSSTSGRSITRARDEAVALGIGINGLPITTDEPYLDRYYEEFVIGGPGAFMIPAENFETFGEAVRRKLILEIAGLEPPARVVPAGWQPSLLTPRR
jgi:hypothetical protein